MITESSSTGLISREYLYFNDEPLALIDNGSIYYFANDQLGSGQALFDQNGQTVWQAQYDPFGAATISPDSTVVNHLRLPGQYFDSETGFHYNWHRYYEPGLGRYLRPDPIGLDGGLNLYSYTENNPVNYTDPLGNSPCDCNEKELCEEVCKNRGGVVACVHSYVPFLGDFTACKCLDDDCEDQAQRDEAICRKLKDPAVRARCWASANERYGACRAGRPLPPLVTW